MSGIAVLALPNAASRLLPLLLAALIVGCDGSDDGSASTPTTTVTASAAPTRAQTEAPTAVPTAPPTPSPASPTASPTPAAWDVRVRRLAIPSLGIDAEVVGSEVVLDTSPTPPGCPTPEPGSETLTVPPEGIATPEEALEGLENMAWVFGHSRWQGEPGLLAALQDIAIGDEVLVDGTDRRTGDPVAGQRFVVEGVYLADKDSASAVIEEPSAGPRVILQTSVRESGAGRTWLLDREQVLARAENLVAGDLEDPCKYLLLFVVARAS